ncbi:MAG: hypothetical protein OEY88_01570 [Candidatus Bathyarchaeota archaeon]|nr:hypothetical protein [Candidatus Bathyarchaeota archaeon]
MLLYSSPVSFELKYDFFIVKRRAFLAFLLRDGTCGFVYVGKTRRFSPFIMLVLEHLVVLVVLVDPST